MTHHTRRGFLGLLGAGAASLAFLPRLRAAGPAKARRILVLNLLGGIRSSAAFLASELTRYNPYGLIPGTPTPLGKLLDDPRPDTAFTLGADWKQAKLPRLRDVANQLSIVGTWSEARGDHQRSRVEEPTGSATGQEPGLLTRVAAGIAAASGHDSDMPPFHLEPVTLFGNAGGLNRFTPVELASFESLPSAASDDPLAAAKTGHSFATDDAMRERFDRARIAARAGRGRVVAETHSAHKRAARTVGARLAQPDIAVGTDDTTALGTVRLATGDVPLTNAMLREAMLACTFTDDQRTMAIDAALSIRLLQLGSPAVVLEVSDFDFHSGERQQGPATYGFAGRLWAALAFLLARIPDPSGDGMLLDHTLVTTFSDFGRDGANGGWNGGDGSDHGLDASCFYLAHPVMGAGVKPGQLVGGVSTATYDARANAIAPQRYLATLLHALGLHAANPEWGFPDTTPLTELWT